MTKKKTYFPLTSRLALIIVVIIVSFLAAFLGQVLLTGYISSPSLVVGDSLIVRQSRDRGNALLAAAQDVLQAKKASLVEFYQDGPIRALRGRGFVVTNDGWLAGIPSQDGGGTQWNFVRLDSGEFLPITSVVEDPASSLVFVKVEGARLSPVTFNDGDVPTVLQRYLLVRYGGLLQESQVIGQVVNPQTYLSSDVLNEYVLATTGYPGDLVFNEDAAMVGLVTEIDEALGGSLIIPTTYIQMRLQQLLRTEALTVPQMGFYYVDLSAQPLQEDLSGGLTSGALVTTALSGQPTNYRFQNSPVYSAGLRLGDIIVSFDGNPVDSENTLSSYVITAEPGRTIELGILRNQQPITLKYSLK